MLTAKKAFDDDTRLLATIIYGEASFANNADEIGGIAFAVANRALAWGGKTVTHLLKAGPNYSFVVSDGSPTYAALMKAADADIQKNVRMRDAVAVATRALARIGIDPSNGAYWWDGLDFKTNKKHRKIRDGFRYGDPSHDIFGVKETSVAVTEYWRHLDKKTHKVVNGKERGSYTHVWVSTAAHGQTIFWTHDPDYLTATACLP